MMIMVITSCMIERIQKQMVALRTLPYYRATLPGRVLIQQGILVHSGSSPNA